MFRHIMQRISGMVSGLRQRFQQTEPLPKTTGRKAPRVTVAKSHGHKPTSRPKRKRQVRAVKKT
jgi:hypothetical protein